MTSNTMEAIGDYSTMNSKNTTIRKTLYSGKKGLKYSKIYKTDHHWRNT
jgi:hypothetical protein